MNEAEKLELTHPTETIGRYVLYGPIARGGMATVHYARLLGDDGFSRIVAAKRLHPQFAEDADFVAMFRDEAQIASQIHHPNVVPVLDLVVANEKVILVQEYVHGVPLDKLFRDASANGDFIPVRIAVGIVAGILAGLEAAHTARDSAGDLLNVVHRDVSPQNVIVSSDGIPRLIDFGIAKARSSGHVTREGLMKGKLAYMAPEQIRSEAITCRADIYASGVLLWELLTMRRMHAGHTEMQILTAVLSGGAPSPLTVLDEANVSLSTERRHQIGRLQPILECAIATVAQKRWASAGEMQSALEDTKLAANSAEIKQWITKMGAEFLDKRQHDLASNEASWRSLSKIAVAGLHSESRLKISTPVLDMSTLNLPGLNDPPSVLAQKKPARRHLPLAIAITLILGVLGWTWVGHKSAPVSAPQSTPTVAAIQMATPPPVLTISEPAPVEIASVAAPKATPRWTAPARLPITLPVRAAAPAPSAASVQTKVDCDPPFYFEGTKKVFKLGCL